MNVFYLKVELITLCSVLAYFYVALKHFNVSGNYISKQLSFLAYSFLVVFMAVAYNVSLGRLSEIGFMKNLVTALIISLTLIVVYKMYTILKEVKGSIPDLLIAASIFVLSILMFFVKDGSYQIAFSMIYSVFLIIVTCVINYNTYREYKKIDFVNLYLIFLVFLTLIGLAIFSYSASEAIMPIMFLALKILLVASILCFFSKAQKILRKKTDDYNFQNKMLTQAEIKILKLAYIDPVTEIPNNVAFQKDFEDKDHLNDKRLVLLINLDNFKFVNNIIGFTKGNEYLKRVAKLINEVKNPSDKVYSMNGDRFAIIHYGDEASAASLASDVINMLNKSQDLAVKHYKMGASIGISNISKDHDYNKTIREVEMALSEVKNNGKNNYLCYSSKLGYLYESKLIMENKLEMAILENQFQMYFQPQVDIETSNIVGLEALIRWIDGEGKFIPPDEFIPLAEKTNKMNRISSFIMDESFRKLREIADSGYKDIKISINVSAVEIFEENFVKNLFTRINKHGVDPNMVNLEITETSLIENIDLASGIFKELRKKNISLALDDFGVGYSSLNYFSKFPISEVKFDKSFTDGLVEFAKNETILRHFTALSHTLGIEVVIEGVETAEQLDIIRRLGCNKYQGYYYSRPIPFEKALELIKKNNNIENETTFNIS